MKYAQLLISTNCKMKYKIILYDNEISINSNKGSYQKISLLIVNEMCLIKLFANYFDVSVI